MPQVVLCKGSTYTNTYLCGYISNVKLNGNRVSGVFSGIVTINDCVESNCNSININTQSILLNLNVAKNYTTFFAMAKRKDDECKFDGGAIKKTSQELFEVLKSNSKNKFKAGFELEDSQITIKNKVTQIDAGVIRVTDKRIK